jgi:poly-gamma-glutamate capsule biosynthesis protein CapA/YwtB (metallophosphatase superfamily)
MEASRMTARRDKAVAILLLMTLALVIAAGGCGGQASTSAPRMKFAALWSSIAGASGAGSGLVTISAGGDVNFGDGVTPSLEAGGLDYPFAGVNQAFASTDVSFVNLECCIAAVGSPVGGKEFTFRGPPDSAGALADGNIKVVSMANNHTKDFGAAALSETFVHLKANGIAWCGAGNNSVEAYTPAVLNAHGRKVAFVAFTEVVPDGWLATTTTPGCATTNDPKKVAATIKAARAKADYVVASFHWGIELATSPNSEQRNLAHLAVDNGADLVLGHHPHVVQGFEMYKNRLIAYSLGNFVFSPPRAESARSVMVMALLGPGGVVEAKIVPAAIVGCRPNILNGEAGNAWVSTMSGYSKALGTTMTVAGGRGYISGGTPQPLK